MQTFIVSNEYPINMVIKLGHYMLHSNHVKGKLCPLCLEKVDSSLKHNCLMEGKVILKRDNYILFKITKDNSITKRMLEITNTNSDDSDEYILLYVDKIFVGFKGNNIIKFIDGFNGAAKTVLEEYSPRKSIKKT